MDGGTPAKTGSALVIIKLQDVDDNSAVFTEMTYQFSVIENNPVGVIVGTVTALDNDLAPYNTVYYEIEQDDSDSFHIDPLNGLSFSVYYCSIMHASPPRLTLLKHKILASNID